MLSNQKNELYKNKILHLAVKVRPGATKTLLRSVGANNDLKVDLREKAENGRANQALIKFLAREFKITAECIRIVSGNSTRKKLIKIEINT